MSGNNRKPEGLPGGAFRLDKYLADLKAGSRSEVKLMIRNGRVCVNGEVVRDAGRKVFGTDTVTLDGRTLCYASTEYLMLNKPAGVLSATRDKRQKTVLDLVSGAKRKDLFPVGRLDRDTEGLLLLTNDGALAHGLLSPKRHVDKVYFARVRGRVTEREVSLFREGILLKEDSSGMSGKEFFTQPAELEILKVSGNSGQTPDIDGISEVRLTVHEGKFHQVKRMFGAVGMEVVYLKRLSMGGLALDDALAPGEYRHLTEEETMGLFRAAGMNPVLDDDAPTEEAAWNKLEVEPIKDKINLLETMLDGIQAVIFDLDGTLVDSMWMWREIDIEYLGRFGIPLPDGLQSKIEGMSFSETAEYFKRNFPAITESIDEMKAEWNRMAWDKYVNEVPLKPGMLPFLKLLRHRGIRTGIATSNSIHLVSAVLESLSVREYFDEVHTACEVGKGKPAPDLFLFVADRLGVTPERCLVFEDICKGIQAGKSAGMRVCAVEDEYSHEDRERKRTMADYYIETYLDFGL